MFLSTLLASLCSGPWPRGSFGGSSPKFCCAWKNVF